MNKATSQKKRELIMVTMAGLAVLYGAIDFMFIAPGRQAPKQDDTVLQAKAMLAGINDELTSAAGPRQDDMPLTILDRAQLAWPAAAFIDQPQASLVDPHKASPVQDPDTLAYTGFIGMADRNLAIINGLDYQIGDRIQGFRLKEITSTAILLERDGATTLVPIQDQGEP